MNNSTPINTEQFQMGGHKAAYVLVICSLLWMINFMDRQLFSVILEPIKQDLGLTDAQAGLATSVLFLSMAVFAMPMAYLSDRWSRNKMIAMMAIFWSVSILFTGMARDFLSLCLARFATGLGVAGFSSTAIALISSSYPEEVRAKQLGIFNLFQALGIVLSFFLGGYISVKWGGWEYSFLIFAVPGIIVGFFAFFMQDYTTSGVAESGQDNHGFLSNVWLLLKIPTILWFYAGYTMVIISSFSVLSWMPALMMRKFNISEGDAGLVVAIAASFTIPGAVMGGYLADRWQKKNKAGRLRFAAVMSFLSMLAIIASLVSIFILHDTDSGFVNIWIFIGAFMASLFCILNASITPAVMAATQSVVSQNQKSMVWGQGLFFIMLLGGAWAPTVTGYLSDLFGGTDIGLAKSLIIVNFSGLFGFLFLWKSSRYYPEDLKRL